MSRASRERRAALRDRSALTARSLQRATDAVGAVSASSPLGTVEVSLDPRGVVASVTVGAQWQREALPATLGAVVLGVAGDAQAKRLTAWGEEAERELSEPAPTVATPLAEVRDQVRAIRGAAGDRALDDAIRQVGGLRDSLDELIAEIEAVATARHTGFSSARHATAVATGLSEIVDLSFDTDWLDHAHSFNIGREATEAIAAALAASAATSLDAVVARSRLGRLRAQLLDITTPDDRSTS